MGGGVKKIVNKENLYSQRRAEEGSESKKRKLEIGGDEGSPESHCP